MHLLSKQDIKNYYLKDEDINTHVYKYKRRIYEMLIIALIANITCSIIFIVFGLFGNNLLLVIGFINGLFINAILGMVLSIMRISWKKDIIYYA